jgi:putative inorganic carbon (hco3(-)) transporter
MSIEQRAPYLSEQGPLVRLCGTGVFNDPNDYALILILAMCGCGYGLGERRWGSMRWALLVPLALLGYALVLTHSRGGALSGIAAIMAYLATRLGWRNALPILWLLLLPLPALIPSRQTDLNLDDPEDSFQQRLELWGLSLDAFRSSPVLGIGQGKLVDTIGFVSHNSFIHAFAELGLIGGVAFLGAFYLLARGLLSAQCAERDIARLRPYILAIVVGYGAGLLSLSRCYTVTTQLVLGLGTASLAVACRSAGAALPRLDLRCVVGITAVGLLFLASAYMFVRVMTQGAI